MEVLSDEIKNISIRCDKMESKMFDCVLLNNINNLNNAIEPEFALVQGLNLSSAKSPEKTRCLKTEAKPSDNEVTALNSTDLCLLSADTCDVHENSEDSLTFDEIQDDNMSVPNRKISSYEYDYLNYSGSSFSEESNSSGSSLGLYSSSDSDESRDFDESLSSSMVSVDLDEPLSSPASSVDLGETSSSEVSVHLDDSTSTDDSKSSNQAVSSVYED